MSHEEGGGVELQDASVAAAGRLARLMADGKGAEALAEMQKLYRSRAEQRHPDAVPFGAGPADDGLVGVWRPERTDDGIALRRDDSTLDWWLWRHADHIPAAGGAKRVVLVGESTARGWLFDPAFNPADALARYLDNAGPGQYQVVDLARTAADLDMLARVVRNLPLIKPDVVVLFAGNNLAFPPLDDSYRDILADALRHDGYSGMRQRFVDDVVVPRVTYFLDRVAALQHDHGIHVVVVVPQSNLRGWVPAPQVEVPALASDAMKEWYAHRRAATTALEQGLWDDARRHAARMSVLDSGSSPSSWYLQGKAVEALGDGAAARHLLERARDAACGLLLDHVNNAISDIRRLEIELARRHGFSLIDLSEAFASPDLPQLPDSRFFLDNCHLTDEGIEHAMSLVADAVLGQPEGTTPRGGGAAPPARAVAHALAAAYCAYRHQPAEAVRAQLRMAVKAEPDVAVSFLNTFLDLLESPGPKWIQPGLMELLATTPQAFMLCLQMAQTRHHSLGFWTLRDCIRDVLQRPARQAQAWVRRDLLALPDARGFQTPSFAPGKAYYEATTERTSLAVALDEPVDAVIRLTYRLRPNADRESAVVRVNGVQVGSLPCAGGWSSVAVEVPADACRSGVNWITIEWPIPGVDLDAHIGADGAALARRTFPRVLYEFGALFSAFFQAGDQARRSSETWALAGRTDYSAFPQPVAGGDGEPITTPGTQ